jgi:hypothetical protein
MDDDRFSRAYEKGICIYQNRKCIGVLGEKKLHSILKYYIESDDLYHEIRINGFFADIYKDNVIYEIQTSSFNRLRNKLNSFLDEYNVNIIYPIPYNKWIYWISDQDGTISDKRKSPKKGNYMDAFKELYKIKMFLRNEKLKITLMLIDMHEYRLLNGWSKDFKKGSSRYERIPTKICDSLNLSTKKDYLFFFPDDLQSPFTVKKYSEVLGINRRLAGLMLNIMNHLDVIRVTGKQKNAYLYEICK